MQDQIRIFERGSCGGVLIRPRWPSSRVLISSFALDALCKSQLELPDSISLILTRGFEPKNSSVGLLRMISRSLGIIIFKLIYPKRKDEVEEIFGSNGHDLDGHHVDISFSVLGKKLSFLPLSVFTPLMWQKLRKQKNEKELKLVKLILIENGFTIHNNETESLQIHCDFIGVAP